MASERKKMKTKLWVNMVNGGDGSAYFKLFNTEEKAEASSEWREKEYGESFCDDVFSIILNFDENGWLLNEDSVKD